MNEGTHKTKKVLVFPFNLLSHYLRCLVLADRYDKRRYEFIFLHSKEYSAFVEKHGYQTFWAQQFDSSYAMQCSRRFNFSWLNDNNIERVFLSQVNALKTFQPDEVIGDFAPALKMACESTGVKYIALVNGYMTRYYAFTRRLSRTHKAYPVLKLFPEKLISPIIAYAEGQSFKYIHQPFSRLRKKYGLNHVSDFLAETEGDVNFICDLPELFPQKELPSNYRFIDPLMYAYSEMQMSYPNHEKNKPVIVVCMGSTGDWKSLNLLNDISFAKYTIITMGDKERILSAAHVFPYDFANMDKVLQQADLMICHGGNGTVYFGLKHGLFMLCLTSHFEQEWNVQALERIGKGKPANNFGKNNWLQEIEKALALRKAKALTH